MLRTLSLFLLFFINLGSAVTADSFEDANAAFATGDYAKAVEILQQSMVTDGPSAARLYNLGNEWLAS